MPHPRLKLAAAYFTLELEVNQFLIDCAHEILNDGIYSYSLGELATLKNPDHYECRRWLNSTLAEFNLPLMTPEDALNTILEFQVLKLVECGTPIYEFLNSIYHIRWQLRLHREFDEREVKLLEPFLSHYYQLDEFGLYWDMNSERDYQNQQLDFETEVLKDANDWIRLRKSPPIDRSCLNDANRTLGMSIRDNKLFHLLPILADELEGAGCGNEELLDHLRYQRPHHTRCVIVDYLLENK